MCDIFIFQVDVPRMELEKWIKKTFNVISLYKLYICCHFYIKAKKSFSCEDYPPCKMDCFDIHYVIEKIEVQIGLGG